VIGGETISKWTEDWWTWVVQSQTSQNPLSDATGAFATIGNDNPNMFFIGGTFGGDVTRNFDVPHDTPLLVPLINASLSQYTGTGQPNGPKDPVTGTPAAANAYIKQFDQSITSLHLSIDGVSVGNLFNDLVNTGQFSLGVVAANSVASDIFGLTVGSEMSHSQSTGYWAVVKGFAPNTDHTLDFGGSSSLSGGFSVNVHDTIHVV
jgi:hypothetical protein